MPKIELDTTIQDVVASLKEWTRQDGGIVQAIRRASDFIDLTQIGAGAMPQRRRKRGRESIKNRSLADRSGVSTCPSENKHLVKYGPSEGPGVICYDGRPALIYLLSP